MRIFRAPRLFKILFTAVMLAALWRMARADEATDMAAGLQALRSGDFTGALAVAGPKGGLASDIVEWHRLRSSRGNASFADYRDFLARRSDWPGLPYLMKFGESAMGDNADPAQVVAYFGKEPPQTGEGAIRAIRAHLARGETGDATALAVLAWRDMSLSEAEELALLQMFPQELAKHHRARLDNLCWNGLTKEAERMLPRVSEDRQKLALARIGLRRQVNGVDALVAAVPAELADYAGLAYERFLWRMKKGRTDDAADLMALQSTSASALGEPERWADARRRLARDLMREGKPDEAYNLASRHFLKGGDDYSDLEWLSGYIALRYLKDPARALDHFQRFRVSVATPISLGRAGYWEGRALDAMGAPMDAKAAYSFGAEYQTSFYGLLAAEKAGLTMDPALMGTETYPDWGGAGFMKSSVMQAALLLRQAGERDLAERFMRHLGESLTPVELGQMADMALAWNEPHIALSIAKFAADRGVVLNRAYYPVTGLSKAQLPVPAELALSIARRESEFDPTVVSPAGARGLMQLMPATAKAMANKTGVDFSVDRLLTDPAYNAALGSAYLAQLIGEFGGNYALVAAAYNAGPSRPRRWMSERGDPRDADVDAVDWIEHIPFRETQNYVMRVMESLPVYRARLHGRVEPITLSADLEAR